MSENNTTFKKRLSSFFTTRRILMYSGILIAFLIWILFLDEYSLYNKQIINKEIESLEREKAYYQQEMKKDKEALKKIMQPDGIERYAREHYYMKRDSEDVYLIEYKEIDESEND